MENNNIRELNPNLLKKNDGLINNNEENIKEYYLQEIIESLSSFRFDVLKTQQIIESSKIPDEVVDEAIKYYFIHERPHLDRITEIVETLHPSDGVIKSPEVIELVKYRLIESGIPAYFFKYVKEAINIFSIPEQVVKEAVIKTMIDTIESPFEGTLEEYIDFIYENFPFGDEILSSPEVIEKVENTITYKIRSTEIYSYKLDHLGKLKEIFKAFPAMEESVVEEVKIKVLNEFKNSKIFLESSGYLDLYERFFNIFPERQKIINESIQLVIAYYIFINNLKDAQFLINKFPINQELIIESVKQGLADRVKEFKMRFSETYKEDYINKTLEIFNLKNDILDSPKIREIIKVKLEEAIIEENGIRSYDLQKVINFINYVPLPVDTRSEVLLPVLVQYFLDEKIDLIQDLLTKFPFPLNYLQSSKIQSVARQAFINCLLKGAILETQILRDMFILPHEFLTTSEVISAAEKGVTTQLLNVNIAYGGNYEDGYSGSVDSFDTVRSILKIYPFSTEKIKSIYYLNNFPFKSKLFLQEQVKEVLDPFLKKTTDIFGYAADTESYNMIKDLMDGNLSNELKAFGVKETGNTGINQLEQRFRQFKKEVIKEDFDPEILLENRFANKYFQNYTRFANAQWKGAGHSFDQLISRYINAVNEYEIAPLNPAFTPSEILNINSVDHSQRQAVEYSEQFINRFTTLLEDIKKAKERLNTKNPLTSVADELEKIKQDELVLLKQKLQVVPEKAKAFLSTKVDELEKVNTRDVKNFQSNFEQLSQLKGTESLLRQSVFTYAFAKNRSMLDKDLEKINIKNPALDDISWALNFIDHITNQETFAKYFTDKHSLLAFEKNINARALSEELSKFQNSDTAGTTPFKFIPTRGLLLELSGHISDACWADKYEHTIPVDKQNFSAVTMIQNPDNAFERIAGAALLIETTSTKGEPLLVIRGLNPLEGIINQLQISDFYDKFTTYTKDLAEKSGRKLAIVIDDHSGGSATNRPMLFNYLSSLQLRRVTVPYEETEFNGYDITHNTYLVD